MSQNNKEIEALLDMFTSEGWKIFQADINIALSALKESSPSECDTNDKWQFRRGEIQKLMQIAGYENIIRSSLEESNSVEIV